jgi:hypothetical protein
MVVCCEREDVCARAKRKENRIRERIMDATVGIAKARGALSIQPSARKTWWMSSICIACEGKKKSWSE